MKAQAYFWKVRHSHPNTTCICSRRALFPCGEMVCVLHKARRSHKNGDSFKSSKSVHKPTGSQSHVSARVWEQDSSPSPRPALTVSTAAAEHKQQLPAPKAGFAFRHAQTEQLQPSTDQQAQGSARGATELHPASPHSSQHRPHTLPLLCEHSWKGPAGTT